MYDLATTPDTIISQRIIDLLAQHTVLSLNEIFAALSGIADADQVRGIVASLRRQHLVALRAHRRGIWFMGYVAGDTNRSWEPEPDEIPQPFRDFLSQLSW